VCTRMSGYHRGRVKSHYSDENEQSYYSEDNLSEVFAMPRPARSDSKLPNDWRRSPFHTASTQRGPLRARQQVSLGA